MARGGKRDGAGRKPGSANTRSKKLQNTIEVLTNRTKGGEREPITGEVLPADIMPLDFLLGVMRDQDRQLLVRIDAAKASAPYCHAKLSQVEHKGDLTVSHEQALKELA